MLREAKIKTLMFDKSSNAPVVILEVSDTPMVLPIWIGSCEAMALSLALERAEFPRPLTHDLLLNTVEALDAQVTKVVIDSLRENTYYAKLVLKDLSYPDDDEPGDTIEIDCRPSDALVIAAKKSVPIYTTDEIILEGSIKLTDGEAKDDEKREFNKFVENLDIEKMKEYFQKEEKRGKDEKNG